METTIKLPETTSPDIKFNIAFNGKVKVYVNGNEIKRSKEKGKPYLIPMTDGSVGKIFLKRGFVDNVPKVLYNNKEILLVEKLEWYEYAICALPLLLLFLGGAIGALFGALGTVINLNIFRNIKSITIKVLLSIVVLGISWLLYFIVALSFLTAIG